MLYTVIRIESVHRATQYISHFEAAFAGCLGQFLRKEVSDAACEVHSEISAAVCPHVPIEKTLKLINYKSAYDQLLTIFKEKI